MPGMTTMLARNKDKYRVQKSPALSGMTKMLAGKMCVQMNLFHQSSQGHLLCQDVQINLSQQSSQGRLLRQE